MLGSSFADGSLWRSFRLLFSRILLTFSFWLQSATRKCFQQFYLIDYHYVCWAERNSLRKKDEDEDISQSRVCQTCKAIDFSALCESENTKKRWPWRYLSPASLGTVRRLLDSQRRCDLCRAVVEALEEKDSVERLMENEVLIGGYPFDGPNACVPGSHGAEPFRAVHLHVFISHNYGPISVLHLQPAQYPIPRAIGLLSGVNSCGPGKHGRLLTDRDDRVGLYKDWLHLCETQHDTCDKYDGSISTISSEINLVDVRTGRVVQATTDDRYVALSYVWGSKDHLKLSRTNTNSFMRRGIEGNVPKTIREAMTVVNRMGINYLWVDALCIVQDDDVHKAAQVNQMSAIYAKAIFVIVAAAGQDAHAGLFPGRERAIGLQRPLHIGRATFLSILNEDVARGSTFVKQGRAASKYDWTSRAWTLQEILFSRRALVFQHDQVYWYCREGMCYEESATENIRQAPSNVASMAANISSPHSAVMFNRRFRGVEIAIPNLTPLPDESGQLAASGHAAYIPLLVYKRLVSEYSARFMSDHRDVLVAFSGIIRGLQHQHSYYGEGWPGLELTWGVSRHELGWALSWVAIDLTDNGRAERLRKRREPHPSTREDSYGTPPSWSWTAWYADAEGKGRVCIGGDSPDFSSVLPRPEEVVFYLTTTDGTMSKVQAEPRCVIQTHSGYGPAAPESRPRGQDYASSDWKEEPTEMTSTDLEQSSAHFMDAGLLVFYTSTATLTVLRWTADGKYQYTIPAAGFLHPFCKETHDPDTPCYCGHDHIGIPWMGSTDHIYKYQHERNGWVSSDYKTRIRGRDSMFHKEASEGDLLTFDFCVVSRSSTDRRELNVLIVEWIDGIAYRVGIAYIKEDTWVHIVNRRWRRVTLG